MRVFPESRTPPMPAEFQLEAWDRKAIDERMEDAAADIAYRALTNQACAVALVEKISGEEDEAADLASVLKDVLYALRVVTVDPLVDDPRTAIKAARTRVADALMPLARRAAEDRRDFIESQYVDEQRAAA